MCQHMHLLVHAGPYRRVAQCEHGTIHLTWDISTIHIGPDDFMTFARLLDQWEKGDADEVVIEGWGQIVCDARGAARIWIGQAGLTMTADDLGMLCRLIRHAASEMQTAVVKTAQRSQAVLNYPVLLIDASAATCN